MEEALGDQRRQQVAVRHGDRHESWDDVGPEAETGAVRVRGDQFAGR
jgi:hypothetical protein